MKRPVIGIVLIVLVLSLPIYSAQVLATSVQITKNQGQAAIPKFIDAQGDVWTVEATITGAPTPTINPSDVKLKIGQNEAPFQSCSATALGIACEYISPLTDGVMEGEYTFQAVYTFLNQLALPEAVSNSDVIKADGTGPTIEFKKLQQNEQGQVELDFTVKDKKIGASGAPAVGIKTIEILDADTGNVLQVIAIPAPGMEQYNYDPDADVNGILPAQLSGEGLKRIKLRAEDWLGHASSQNPVNDFQADFIAPVIKDNLNFTKIGKFIGDTNVITDMTIDIEETTLKEVKASSAEAGLDNTPATACTEDAEQEKLWHCRWSEVEVQPTESIAVSILATDQKGNKASKTISRSFTKDSSAPQIEFFGTERQFEEQNFVRDGAQRIILRVKELGAGIDEDGIRANLLALGKGTSEAPDSCEQTETTFNCFWETGRTGLDGTLRIGLSKFQDKVGNQGTAPEIELVVDNAGPKVEKLAVFGVSEIGDKDYFQSNDVLKVKLEVVEMYGLVLLLNLNEVVLDAETKFPETELTSGLGTGWAAFTDDDCTREEGKWLCELETPPIKSGPDDNVQLEVRIRDTAGNEAKVWPETAKNAKSFTGKNNNEARYTFSLLGLSEENEPDFWEVDKKNTKTLVGFVDLDIVQLIPARIPVQVALKTDNTNVKAIEVRLVQCTAEAPVSTEQKLRTPTGLAASQSVPEGTEGPEEITALAPEIQRTLLYGRISTEGETAPMPKLLLEFAPFESKEAYLELLRLASTEGKRGVTAVKVPVTCQLQVYSKLGKNALRSAEMQEVSFSVPFGFTKLGAMDENLEGKINEIKEETWFTIADKIKVVNKAIQWANWGIGIIQIINSVVIIYEVVTGTLTPLEAAAITSPIARGACAKVKTAQKSVIEGIKWLQIPVAILSCDVRAAGRGGENLLGMYGGLQRTALDRYNAWSGRALLGLPAKSAYENIWVSMIALCPAGIVYNLEKYRQVRCREMLCYQNEVPAGIATPESCAKLGEYLSCRYVWGNLLGSAFPLIGAWDAIITFIKDWVSSPLGWVRALLMVPCIITCGKGVTLASTCTVTTVIIKLGDVLDGLVGTFKFGRPDITEDPFCKQIK